MAKQAKEGAEIVISKSLIDKFDSGIDEALANIESARGKFMNAARRQREQMTALHEDLATRGVPQKLSKLRVQARTLEAKLKGKLAELDAEELRLLKKIAKTAGNKMQLSMFDDLPNGSSDDDDEDTGGRPQTGKANLADAEAAGSA